MVNASCAIQMQKLPKNKKLLILGWPRHYCSQPISSYISIALRFVKFEIDLYGGVLYYGLQLVSKQKTKPKKIIDIRMAAIVLRPTCLSLLIDWITVCEI